MIDDDDCGATCGMLIGRGSRSTLRKPAPIPLCRPKIQHDLKRQMNIIYLYSLHFSTLKMEAAYSPKCCAIAVVSLISPEV
jgi:hypothetical protein